MQAQAKIDEKTLVLLTAAAVAAVGRNVRVRQVRMIQRGSSLWATLGRAAIHGSHKFGKSL